MSIGAYIMIHTGIGNTFEALPVDLEGAVTEIRIEQHLDRRTSFAIRFQEDFEEGEAATITADQLRGAKGVAIAVASGGGQAAKNGLGPPPNQAEQLVCLVRGQIENSEASIAMAGAGSWYEVRGRDVRTAIDREVKGHSVAGTVDQIAAQILGEITTTGVDVGDSVAEYEDDYPYRFFGTLLEGLERLATLCNYPVWLDYPIKRAALAVNLLGPAQFEIDVHGHFEPSPPRAADAPPGPPIDLGLLGDDMPYLRLMGSDEAQENVVDFAMRNDSEAYSCVASSVVDSETGQAVELDDQESGQEPITKDGEDVKTAGAEDCDRRLVINKVGRPDIAASAARAAANDASWYVKANALTTVHMLGEVLQPHDLVEVIGGGCGIAGTFQVEKVTHVINAAAHWMHIDLRSNSRSLKPPKQGVLG